MGHGRRTDGRKTERNGTGQFEKRTEDSLPDRQNGQLQGQIAHGYDNPAGFRPSPDLFPIGQSGRTHFRGGRRQAAGGHRNRGGKRPDMEYRHSGIRPQLAHRHGERR